MELFDYKVIAPKSRLTVGVKNYNNFGVRILGILEHSAVERGVDQCTYAANVSIMKKLLGTDFEVEVIEKPRKTPIELLRSKIKRRRRVCILEGGYRYYVVKEKKLS